MTGTLFDSAAPIDPHAAVAAGAIGLERYVSQEPAKNLTPAEAQGYLAAGLSVTPIYEDGSSDYLSGAAGGTQHGAVAKRLLDAMGHPTDRALVVAVDTQIQPTDWPLGLAYVRAAAAAAGRVAGVYGEDAFVAYCMSQGVRYGMAASAWERPTIAEGATDAGTGGLVSLAQRLLVAHGHATPVDGTFDPEMVGIVRAFQQAQGYLAVDGVIGQETWNALSPAQVHQTTLPPPAGLAVDVDEATAADWGQWEPETAAPAPSPAQPEPPIRVVHDVVDSEEGAMKLLAVTMDVDENGNGWRQTDTPFANWTGAATHQGSDPSTSADGAYWFGIAHVQERNGNILVSVTGCRPLSRQHTVFVGVAT